MMKKAFAILVALTMLLSLASAFAEKLQVTEDFKTFDVALTVPEGYTASQSTENGYVDVEMTTGDAEKPSFDLHIAPSEELEEQSLKELTEAERASLLELIEADFSAPEHEFFTTPSGNEIILTRETDVQAGEYATMQTIYHGFFFFLSCKYEDYRALTDADIALMHQLTESVDIVGTQK